MTLRAMSVLFAVGCACLAGVPVRAETPVPQVTEAGDLADVLMIGAVIDVMREEGIAYGADMENEMFAGQGGSGWQATVALIYDAAAMRGRFDAAFGAALQGAPQVGEITEFFASDLGRRVLTLEVEARRAMLDPAVEEAAQVAYAGMVDGDEPRVAALQAFVETNDLIESNVMGALNANLAFYQGMAEVGAFEEAMPEDQMLSDVWAQEADVRAETESWLFPYLALAYKPLSDAELAAYQDFSDGPAGQVLNSALFAAFDAVFVAVSRDLGQAAARQMQGQEL